MSNQTSKHNQSRRQKMAEESEDNNTTILGSAKRPGQENCPGKLRSNWQNSA